MNTKKKTILAAAFVVAIIALAGVGFAANFYQSYSGTTTIDEPGTYDVDWVTVGLNDYNANNAIFIAYNTENDEGTIAYTFLGSTVVEHTITVKGPASISTQIQNDTRDSEVLTLTAVITANPVIDSDYNLQYKFGDGDWTTYNASTAKISAVVTASENGEQYTVQWKAVPVDVSAFGANNAPAGYVELPAIQYVVTASEPVTP